MKMSPLLARKPYVWVLGLLAAAELISAHYIQIDRNEFHVSGFPQPHLPPPPTALGGHFELVAQHAAPRQLSPVELMVDLTNELTYRILHYHSILNRNNFAFSPSALVSVLIALYEGSNGRSSLELRNVLQLPTNRDIIRVGYRDIHRRLRTYFFGSDNPLKGLSLNKDNVTITRDYETVLMFYGYDLGMDMVSSTVAPPTTTETTESMKPAEMSAADETTTTEPITTGTTDEATTTTVENTDASTTPATVTDDEMATLETTTTTAATTTTTTEVATTESPAAPEETSTEEETATETATTESTDAETTSGAADDAETGELKEKPAKITEPFARLQKPPTVRTTKSKLVMPRRTTAPTAPLKTPRVGYLPASRHTRRPERAAEPRSKRHLFGFKEFDANLFVTLFNQQHLHSELVQAPPSPHQFTISEGPPSLLVSAPSGPLAEDYTVELNAHYLEQHAQGASDGRQNFNTDVISHVFYLANQQTVHTTFKVYNAVLYYKYLDGLKMSVLELELNTPEYNLMILLPDYHTDLVTAAASLRHGPPLRVLRKQLKPKWVQAIIPDFKLHGSMFLTNDLQNMGICDIFEPNRADFRTMSEEKGIYVRHIEQFINVSIRTRPINQLKRNYGAQTQPIQISVNHPFLFFVVDRDLDVAVMAGRVLNPLNVRIQ